jgi:hypothetical protein
MTTLSQCLDEQWAKIVALVPGVDRQEVLHHVERIAELVPIFTSSRAQEKIHLKEVSEDARRLLLSIANLKSWRADQLDIKTLREEASRVREACKEIIADMPSEGPVRKGRRLEGREGQRLYDRTVKNHAVLAAYFLFLGAGMTPTTTRGAEWERLTVILVRVVTGRRPTGVRPALLAFNQTLGQGRG